MMTGSRCHQSLHTEAQRSLDLGESRPCGKLTSLRKALRDGDDITLWSRQGVNLVCVCQRPVWYQSHHCPWTAALCGLQGLPTDPGPGTEVEVILQPGLSLREETNLVGVPGAPHPLSGWLWSENREACVQSASPVPAQEGSGEPLQPCLSGFPRCWEYSSSE